LNPIGPGGIAPGPLRFFQPERFTSPTSKQIMLSTNNITPPATPATPATIAVNPGNGTTTYTPSPSSDAHRTVYDSPLFVSKLNATS
jgi:hypothetical protein